MCCIKMLYYPQIDTTLLKDKIEQYKITQSIKEDKSNHEEKSQLKKPTIF